jgi:hypothetical protein
VRHYGEIAIPGLQLSPGEQGQDHAKLNFFSQDKLLLFYRFPHPLSSEKVCKRQVIHGTKPEILPALTQGQEFPYCGIDLSCLGQRA